MFLFSLLFPIIGAMGYGTSNALSKITGQAVGTTRGVILQTIFSTLWLAIILLFFWDSESFSFKWAAITLAMAVYGYFPLLFFIKAIKTGKVGVIIPIVDASVIISVLCAVIILGETLSAAGVMFLALIMTGVIAYSVDVRDFKNSSIFDLNSGILYALIAAVLWGVGFFMWSFPVQHIGPFLTALVIEFGVLMTAFVHCYHKKESLINIPPKIWMWGLVIGFFGMLGTLGVNLGIQSAGTAVTMGILGARPAFSAAVGYFMFGERLSAKQVFAAILVMVGVIGMAIVR